MQVYIVTAYRWGDEERHSYVVGACSTLEEAIGMKRAQEDWRGGKYSCGIVRCGIDQCVPQWSETDPPDWLVLPTHNPNILTPLEEAFRWFSDARKLEACERAVRAEWWRKTYALIGDFLGEGHAFCEREATIAAEAFNAAVEMLKSEDEAYVSAEMARAKGPNGSALE